jgi:hypothetical protein
VAAAAAGVVVLAGLLRSVPGPPASVGTGGASSVPSGTTSIAGGRIATPNEPGFPAPPDGALVLSREAGSWALGLAVVPGQPATLVRVSVVSPSGPGAAGLDVGVRFGRRPAVALTPCGPGCYEAEIATANVSRSVSVTVTKEAYAFTLPSVRLPADGARIVERAAQVWRGLKTLVWRERLAASPTNVIHTVVRAVAPDELSYTIAGGSAAVIIDGTRWDRSSPAGRWQSRPQNPPLRQPSPFWASAHDARVLGPEQSGGRGVWLVSFFDPSTPAWYLAAIDKQSYHTLELTMTAASHFMHHVYGPFDVPFRLHPPKLPARRTGP